MMTSPFLLKFGKPDQHFVPKTNYSVLDNSQLSDQHIQQAITAPDHADRIENVARLSENKRISPEHLEILHNAGIDVSYHSNVPAHVISQILASPKTSRFMAQRLANNAKNLTDEHIDKLSDWVRRDVAANQNLKLKPHQIEKLINREYPDACNAALMRRSDLTPEQKEFLKNQ